VTTKLRLTRRLLPWSSTAESKTELRERECFGLTMAAFFARSVRPTNLSAMSSACLRSTHLQSYAGFQLSRLNSPASRRLFSNSNKPKASASASAKKNVEASTGNEGFLARFLGPKEMPPRWTFPWYREMVLLCTVFAITGSSTMVVVSQRRVSSLIVDSIVASNE
jgi:hypothetical protein